jgi:hypothetical protein
MDPQPPKTTPQDSHDAEQRVSDLTGMSSDAAKTFMDFHTGMRWLRAMGPSSQA